MRMKTGPIETGHKTFDAKLRGDGGYIGTGNVSSDTQSSGFIRPYSATECNGFTNPPGHLRDFDLKPFVRQLPRNVLETVLRATQDEQAILYKIRHFNGSSAADEVVHGYVLTRDHHGQYEQLGVWVTGRGKSYDVMNAVVPAIATPPGTLARMRDEIVPNKVKDIEKYVANLRADVREPVEEIIRIIGADPDVGVQSEGFDGWGEHRNLLRALGEPDISRHFRFSVAGTEVLSAATDVIDRLGPGAPEGAPPTASDNVRTVMRNIVAIADDEDKYGLTDDGWVVRAYAQKAAGLALENTGPAMR